MQQVVSRNANDERIRRLYQQLDSFFMQNGFVEEVINGEKNFIKGNLYCVPICVRSLGFFVDYALSREDAQNHLHSDGDTFPLEMDDKSIVSGIEQEVFQSMERYLGPLSGDTPFQKG